jgi:hypothetical protein
MTYRPAVRYIVSFVSLILAFGILAFQHIENQEQITTNTDDQSITVVELFTSQGCSSCPPADALLGEIKERKNVIALSYHVDYWNRLGWKDPFSDATFSKYQRKYASELKSRVYTPQMVINGTNEFVGSRELTLKKNLKKSAGVLALPVPIVNVDGDTVAIEYDLTNAPNYDKAYALLVLDEHSTSVKRGENANRSLTNTNVVVERVELNNTTGSEEFEREIDGDYKVVIVAQEKDLSIVGASIATAY